MVFSCFRTRRRPSLPSATIAASEEGNLNNNNNNNNTINNNTKVNNSTVNKKKNKGHDDAIKITKTEQPIKIKLAPRTTAILQTPKQAVGTRITQATSSRKLPTIELRKENLKPVNTNSPTISPRSSFEMPTITTTATTTTRPISPINGSMKPMMGINQQDELRLALAKRAAKRAEE